jgi:alkyl hydroperoxide reductase subunit D
MDLLEPIKARLPEYAKDIRTNLDATIGHSSLEESDALAVALAAAFAARCPLLVASIRNSKRLPAPVEAAALAAATLMGMNNAWYPYVEMTDDGELRSMPTHLHMTPADKHPGVSESQFEMYALAASIIGKCRYCVASHYALLKSEGTDRKKLRDIGRIAAVVQAAALVLSAEGAPPVL